MSKTKTLPKPSPRRSLHGTPVLAKASVPGDVLGVQGLLAAAEVADLFEGA
jgi:hypothetical protein